MPILRGYVYVFAYIFFLIFGLGPLVQRKADTETSRKTIHILLFFVWVLMDAFVKNTIHQMVVPFLFLILNGLSYRFHLYGSVERKENNHLGTVFFALAVLAVMTVSYFWPKLFLPGGVAVFCLTFGDGFAALAGYHGGKVQLRKNKTVLGFVSCLGASFCALLFFKKAYWPALAWTDILLIACLSAISELAGGGLDNFSITFSTFAASWLLATPVGESFRVGLACALVVFGVVFFSRAITYGGSVLAMGMIITFYCCAGWNGLLYLLTTYFIIFAIGILRGKLQPSREKSENGRSLLQILINGGIGTVCMLLYGILKQEWLQALAVTAIGGCFIDSLSSDLGSLSPQMPYDPFRRMPVAPGISGGMTVLGTAAAALFSCGIGAFSMLLFALPARVAAMIACMTFGQSLLDSAMGSLLQVKYRCGICGKETEKKQHCGKKTVYQNGIAWMDNNMVNLISSMVITGFGALTFYWIL